MDLYLKHVPRLLFLPLLVLMAIAALACESTKPWPDDLPSSSTYQPSFLNGPAADLWDEISGGVWAKDEYEEFVNLVSDSQTLFAGARGRMYVLHEQELGDGTWDQMGTIAFDDRKFRIITNTARHVGLVRTAEDSDAQPPSANITFVGELVADFPIAPASLDLKVRLRRDGVIQDTDWLVVCDGLESLDQSDWLEWDDEKLKEFYFLNCDKTGHPLETIAVLAAVTWVQ